MYYCCTKRSSLFPLTTITKVRVRIEIVLACAFWVESQHGKRDGDKVNQDKRAQQKKRGSDPVVQALTCGAVSSRTVSSETLAGRSSQVPMLRVVWAFASLGIAVRPIAAAITTAFMAVLSLSHFFGL